MMRHGQLIVGVAIGLGIAAGSLGAVTGLQRLQQPELEQNSGNSSDDTSRNTSETANGTVVPVGSEPFQPVSALPASSAVAWTPAENDYLYDLSQALQPRERRRLSDHERLVIGHQIASWLHAGSDYWQIRAQFDQIYRTQIAGDYAHNREVYIKFATERLAPEFLATLQPPLPEPQVVVETRYVETPGKTKIIHVPAPPEVVPVPVPVPVPYPIPPRPSYPDRPHPPHHPHHPGNPDEPHPPEHPGDPDSTERPDLPDPAQGGEPPVTEVVDPVPPKGEAKPNPIPEPIEASPEPNPSPQLEPEAVPSPLPSAEHPVELPPGSV